MKYNPRDFKWRIERRGESALRFFDFEMWKVLFHRDVYSLNGRSSIVFFFLFMYHEVLDREPFYI